MCPHYFYWKGFPVSVYLYPFLLVPTLSLLLNNFPLPAACLLDALTGSCQISPQTSLLRQDKSVPFNDLLGESPHSLDSLYPFPTTSSSFGMWWWASVPHALSPVPCLGSSQAPSSSRSFPPPTWFEVTSQYEGSEERSLVLSSLSPLPVTKQSLLNNAMINHSYCVTHRLLRKCYVYQVTAHCYIKLFSSSIFTLTTANEAVPFSSAI